MGLPAAIEVNVLFKFEFNPKGPSNIDNVLSNVLLSGNTAAPTILVTTEGGRLTPAHGLTRAA
jgi:hypothetical protein